ncbi:MAG: hypothetical protein M3237_06955 [Actinomycetota bacterium]|nr:hypothetical protein [Actinomycetota bacterium]
MTRAAANMPEDAMEVRETTLTFSVARGSGPMTANRTLVFPREVDDAVAAVRGYQVGFAGDDHHVGLLEVALDTAVDQNTVTVNGRLGCRDWSGTWDDDYGGSIQVAVLADLVSATEPPPRGDLQVVDVETNQATQFFRAADHLDTGNVRPDNSIPLVAGKSTGVRAYVDYDATSGLPAITNLTGELIVSSGGAQTTLAPLATINPRRAAEIDRGMVGHTLNFLIPGAWCDGNIEIRLRVFDATAPGQKSAAAQRTLRFVRVNPMRVYAVGINYTGAGLNLPAPVETDFASTFDYARRVWPTGDILFSGYTTLEFDESLAGTASEGCGSGFNSLLDDLRDIKGDTDDLVYGLLPNGTPLTGVGGCGGSGAGTGMVGGGQTAAHEAGHAVGRDHAPCDDSGRCDSPLNTDGSYPRYGSYVSDSIGEFGFDVENNVVFDPASSQDFMGYSGSNWISPHTYAALFSKGDPSPSTGAAPAWVSAYMGTAASEYVGGARRRPPSRLPPEPRPEWIKKREPVLFLRVTVDNEEDEKAQVHPSFTYHALRRPRGEATNVEAHVLDEDGAIIACTYLHRTCSSCDADCGPVDLIGEVPLTAEPHRLVIRRHKQVLVRHLFEDPVEVRCDWSRTENGDLELTWEGKGSGAEIWYLVQWRDRGGVWRGAAPRTTDTRMVLPRRFLYASKDEIQIRVLATELLTTSGCVLKFDGCHEEPPVSISVYDTGPAVAALAVDPLGRQLPGRYLTWFDDDGGEIGRGERLPKGMFADWSLPTGTLHVVPSGLGVTRDEALAAVDLGVVSPGSSRPPGSREHPHRHPRREHKKGWHRADRDE